MFFFIGHTEMIFFSQMAKRWMYLATESGWLCVFCNGVWLIVCVCVCVCVCVEVCDGVWGFFNIVLRLGIF